jgi:hypothetical protein
MIRHFALQAAVALACAIVIALLLGTHETRAAQRYAGGDALVLAAPCLVDALARSA